MDQEVQKNNSSGSRLWRKVMIVVVVLIVGSGLFLLPRGNSCYLKSNSVPANAGLGLGAYLTDRAECFKNTAIKEHDASVCLKIYDRSLITSCVYDTAVAAKDITKCTALKALELAGDQYQKSCERDYQIYIK